VIPCRIAEIEGKHHTPNVGGDLDIYSQYMAGYIANTWQVTCNTWQVLIILNIDLPNIHFPNVHIYQSGKDTICSRSSDSMLQCLGPLFVKFASYNTPLSIHERSKVNCFVPWSRTSINNLSLNVQTEINIRDYITIEGDMTN
jgi:hypothetical protein